MSTIHGSLRTPFLWKNARFFHVFHEYVPTCMLKVFVGRSIGFGINVSEQNVDMQYSDYIGDRCTFILSGKSYV